MSFGQTRSCPFTEIPIEIRLSILDYLLPRDRDNSRTIKLPTRACSIDHGAGINTLVLGFPQLDPYPMFAVDSSPSRFSLRRFLSGISLVSRQLHAESNKVLHFSTFIVDISEQTFTINSFAPFQFIFPPTVREWNPLLPGLDISHVRELKVRLQPSDHDRFWEYMHDCMRALCEDLNQRIDGGGLKKLTIEITEGQSTRASEPPGSLVPASANDVAVILDLLRRHLGNVQKCEIELPVWATGDQGLKASVNETKATVCLPCGTTAIEQSLGAIEPEEPQVEEAALKENKSQEPECDTTPVQDEAREDAQYYPVDEERDRQGPFSWPEECLFKEELFKKQEHEEWDDWYADADCSCC